MVFRFNTKNLRTSDVMPSVATGFIIANKK